MSSPKFILNYQKIEVDEQIIRIDNNKIAYPVRPFSNNADRKSSLLLKDNTKYLYTKFIDGININMEITIQNLLIKNRAIENKNIIKMINDVDKLPITSGSCKL